MNRYLATALSVLALNVAALANWSIEEAFLHGETLGAAVAALACNFTVLIAVMALLRLLLREQRAVQVLRITIVFFGVFVALRFTGTLAWSSDGLPRPWRPVLALAIGVPAALLLPERFWTRATRAVIAGALAFAFAPAVWTSVRAPSLQWRPVRPVTAEQRKAGMPSNRVILLLDEFSESAAQPLVDAMTSHGLQVAHKALKPTGPNTFNVIPALFSGLDFSLAKACGISSVCSGANVLNFAKIHAARDDIDVIGLYLPYCRMTGLRSCVREALPSDLPSPFLRLLDVYASRLSRALPTDLQENPMRRQGGMDVVDAQLAAVAHAPFWEQGGVLYAHIALPHPPGNGRVATLDADYEDNLNKTTAFVLQLTQRLQTRFGDDYSLVIFSDHPLRDWCAYSHYLPSHCTARASFHSTQVPLIVAGPRPQVLPAIDNNIDIFKTF